MMSSGITGSIKKSTFMGYEPKVAIVSQQLVVMLLLGMLLLQVLLLLPKILLISKTPSLPTALQEMHLTQFLALDNLQMEETTSSSH